MHGARERMHGVHMAQPRTARAWVPPRTQRVWARTCGASSPAAYGERGKARMEREHTGSARRRARTERGRRRRQRARDRGRVGTERRHRERTRGVLCVASAPTEHRAQYIGRNMQWRSIDDVIRTATVILLHDNDRWVPATDGERRFLSDLPICSGGPWLTSSRCHWETIFVSMIGGSHPPTERGEFGPASLTGPCHVCMPRWLDLPRASSHSMTGGLTMDPRPPLPQTCGAHPPTERGDFGPLTHGSLSLLLAMCHITTNDMWDP